MIRLILILGLMLTTINWAISGGWSAETTGLLLLGQVFLLAAGRGSLRALLVVGITAYLFYMKYLAGGEPENSGKFGYPVREPGEWRITQRFLDPVGPDPSKNYRHLGEDWARAEGEEVLAVADGTVIGSGDVGPGWGHVVMIRHGDYVALYGHLGSNGLPQLGERVRRGAVIGYVGSTAENGGVPPHLHCEFRTSRAREEAMANGDYRAGMMLNSADPDAFTGDGYFGPRPDERLDGSSQVSGWVAPSGVFGRGNEIAVPTDRSRVYELLGQLFVILVGFSLMFSGPFAGRRSQDAGAQA